MYIEPFAYADQHLAVVTPKPEFHRLGEAVSTGH
jgi:hypothetical protein